MNTTKEKNSIIFILYKNQKQTMFTNIQEVISTEDELILTRSARDKINISLKAVEHYKTY